MPATCSPPIRSWPGTTPASSTPAARSRCGSGSCPGRPSSTWTTPTCSSRRSTARSRSRPATPPRSRPSWPPPGPGPAPGRATSERPDPRGPGPERAGRPAPGHGRRRVRHRLLGQRVDRDRARPRGGRGLRVAGPGRDRARPGALPAAGRTGGRRPGHDRLRAAAGGIPARPAARPPPHRLGVLGGPPVPVRHRRRGPPGRAGRLLLRAPGRGGGQDAPRGALPPAAHARLGGAAGHRRRGAEGAPGRGPGAALARRPVRARRDRRRRPAGRGRRPGRADGRRPAALAGRPGPRAGPPRPPRPAGRPDRGLPRARPLRRLPLAVGAVHHGPALRPRGRLVNVLTVEAVWEALAEVPDPEIPVVSVVDLGLVHTVELDGELLRVELLPTFVGCPALELIRRSVTDRLAGMAPRVEVEMTFAVPWTSDRITADGRRKLRESGFAPPGDAPPDGARPLFATIPVRPTAACRSSSSRPSDGGL